MSDPAAAYEVYAVRYGHVDRGAAENFLDACATQDDGGRPMPMDYYLWVLRGEERTVVVDTGYGAGEAERRGRIVTRPPAEGLAALGVDPATVSDVILTHLHWDHAGNLDLFPAATFHVHPDETAFVVGPAMRREADAAAYSADDIVALVRLVHSGRVSFVSDGAELFAGISVHLVGGHTGGTQVVRVQGRHGPVLLASDAAHFYANLEQRRPFAITHDPGRLLAAYESMLPALARAVRSCRDTTRRCCAGSRQRSPGWRDGSCGWTRPPDAIDPLLR